MLHFEPNLPLWYFKPVKGAPLSDRNPAIWGLRERKNTGVCFSDDSWLTFLSHFLYLTFQKCQL